MTKRLGLSTPIFQITFMQSDHIISKIGELNSSIEYGIGQMSIFKATVSNKLENPKSPPEILEIKKASNKS
jgi:hypothetical protein